MCIGCQLGFWGGLSEDPLQGSAEPIGQCGGDSGVKCLRKGKKNGGNGRIMSEVEPEKEEGW